MKYQCPFRGEKVVAVTEESDVGDSQMVSLRMLSALAACVEPTKGSRKGSMYIEALIGSSKVKALVDTGVTHNFMREDAVKALGLAVTPTKGSIKSINTTAKPVAGEARDVGVKIRDW